MSTFRPNTMADSDNHFRPKYDRQRSRSAPVFPALDVTASEAIIICSAAARASDRRRGRRWDPRYVSLDVDTERTLSRPGRVTGDSAADDERDESVDARKTRRRTAKTASLQNYSQNMAVFVQERIEAIQCGEAETSTTLAMSLPDSHLCPSPAGQSEDEEVTETLLLSRPELEDFNRLQPPLKSAFSAWSSAVTTPECAEPRDSGDEDRPATSFDFPEPPHSAIYRPSSRADDDSPAPGAVLPPVRLHNDTSTEYSKIGLDDMSTPKRARHQHSSSDRLAVRTKDSFPDISPAAFSTPIAHYAQYFPPRNAKLIEPRVISVISPFEGAPITKIHHITATSSHHYLIEGQMFEICR